MYLVVRSPLGGKLISHIWSRVIETKNIIFKPGWRPEVSGDYLTYRIGYAEKELRTGEPIFIKRSDARHLLKVLNNFIG